MAFSGAAKNAKIAGMTNDAEDQNRVFRKVLDVNKEASFGYIDKLIQDDYTANEVRSKSEASKTGPTEALDVNAELKKTIERIKSNIEAIGGDKSVVEGNLAVLNSVSALQNRFESVIITLEGFDMSLKIV